MVKEKTVNFLQSNFFIQLLCSLDWKLTECKQKGEESINLFYSTSCLLYQLWRKIYLSMLDRHQNLGIETSERMTGHPIKTNVVIAEVMSWIQFKNFSKNIRNRFSRIDQTVENKDLVQKHDETLWVKTPAKILLQAINPPGQGTWLERTKDVRKRSV